MGTNLELYNNIKSENFNIKQQLIELAESDLRIKGVDLAKTSYLSYFMDALSFMSSNLMFFSSMNYNEEFLYTAKLSESIYNWSSYLYYFPENAQASYVDLTVTIPITFNYRVEFNIPEGSRFYSKNYNFQSKYLYNIILDLEHSFIQIVQQGTTDRRVIPFIYDSTNKTVTFNITLIQHESFDIDFYIPYLETNQFFTYQIQYNDFLENVSVKVIESNDNTMYDYEYKEKIFLMQSNERQFSFNYISGNRIQLFFGNGIYGKQIPQGSKVLVTYTTTKGESGQIAPDFITHGDKLFYNYNNTEYNLFYTVENKTTGYGGKDFETLEETKQNAIIHNVTRKRLVSKIDYDNITSIIKDLPFFETRQVLKRSDVKTNEVEIYGGFKFNNDIVETTTESFVRDMSIDFFQPGLVWTVTEEYDTLGTITTEYYNPFAMMYNPDHHRFEYLYIINNVEFPCSVTFENNYTINDYPISVNKLNVYANEDYSLITFDYYIYSLNPSLNINGDMSYMIENSVFSEGPFSGTWDPNTNKLSIVLTAENIKYPEPLILNLKLYDAVSGNHFITVTTNATIIYNLKDFMISHCIDEWDDVPTDRLIFEIPLIGKNWWDNLSEDDKKLFESSIIQKLINTVNSYDYKMQNVFHNYKFLKTSGIVESVYANLNSLKNVLTRNVEFPDRNTPPTAPDPNEKFLVGENPTGDWANHANEIAVYETGGTWKFIEVPPETWVSEWEDDDLPTILTYCVDLRWREPFITTPVPLTLMVTTDTSNDAAIVSEDVKNTIINTFNNTNYIGVNPKLFRSSIIKQVQSLSNVTHCEIMYPMFNIDMNIDIGYSDLPAELLRMYIPEYTYLRKDKIKVYVKKERIV